MAKPTAQQCHAMTTYFVKQYESVLGRATVVNRNKTRWGFEAILMDFTAEQTKSLIDYYLEHYASPNVEWFLFNYDKVVEAKQDQEERQKTAAKRREETARRLEEWRNRWQQTD